MARLTNAFVEKLKNPEKGQVIYADDGTKGFGIRVTPGAKAYIVQGRVNGRVVRYKIGNESAWSCQKAEKEAKRILGLMSQGIDPNAQKQVEKAATVTIDEAFERYLGSGRLKAGLRLAGHSCRYLIGEWFERYGQPIIAVTLRAGSD